MPVERPFPIPIDPFPVTPQNILSTAIVKLIGGPPQPYPPSVAIVNRDGTPTFEYHLFMTRRYEWEMRLLSALSTPPP